MSASTAIVAERWMNRLRDAWLATDLEAAMELFRSTREYYERPFAVTTEQSDIREFWKDLGSFTDPGFEFDILAVDGPRGVVHISYSFTFPEAELSYLVDGVYVLDFDDDGDCVVFRQWWFAKENNSNA
ncbi:nuclear transport factor 2 family protein [Microbacterium sp. X-17]|uniref:nuclear transport factor 2 family protein n=1 Tax=Microbacterium sp. X-17 TaxID=3144404 RepID=UPI0031F4FD49